MYTASALALADIFLLSPAGVGIGSGLDFSYRFKHPFIINTNFHLSSGVDSPIIATDVHPKVKNKNAVKALYLLAFTANRKFFFRDYP